MSEIFKKRTSEFQERMSEANIDVMLLMDPDSIYYFTGFWGDLGVEFGRPSIVAIPRNEEPTIITSSIEGEMCKRMTWISKIDLYHDSVGKEWIDPLEKTLETYKNNKIAIVPNKVPPLVLNYFHKINWINNFFNGENILTLQRMIKSSEEIIHLKQAGQVATAMTDAAKKVIKEGVSEYEIAIAIQAGGTRKAGEIIKSEDSNSLMSPVIHNLQSASQKNDIPEAHYAACAAYNAYCAARSCGYRCGYVALAAEAARSAGKFSLKDQLKRLLKIWEKEMKIRSCTKE